MAPPTCGHQKPNFHSTFFDFGTNSLLAELATFTRNTMALASRPQDTFLLYPQPTPLQTRTFELLGTSPRM